MRTKDTVAVDRRTVLRGVGAAGLGGVGATTGAAARDSITRATFVEVGLGFEHSTDVDLVDHYDPLEFYSVGDDGIRFSVIRESNLETFETNDSVLRSQSLRGLPAVLTRAEHTTIGTDLNGRLRPTAGVPLSEAVVTPAIRVEAEGRSVKLTARGDVVTVPADATRTLELGPVSSETRNGAAVDATAEVSVRNHGTLDVYADRIVGGQ